jgi:hypothetical protein
MSSISIKLTATQVKALKKQLEELEGSGEITLPTKTWNPVTDDGYYYDLKEEKSFFTIGETITSRFVPIMRETSIEAGVLSKDTLEFLRMKQYQSLNDLLGDGTTWKPDWNDLDQLKCCVVYDVRYSEYVIIRNQALQHKCTPYFSEEAITTLLAKLNSGTVCFKTGKGCVA